MGCNCKNSILKRAKTLLSGRTYGQVEPNVQKQLRALWEEQFGRANTEEEVIKWLK